MKSITYFVAVPSRVTKFYLRSQILLGLVSLVPFVVWIVSGTDMYFYGEPTIVDNFFVNSFTSRFGLPKTFPRALLFSSSLINILGISVLLYRLWQASNDIFLMVGLCVSFVVYGIEYLALPFSLQYYIPLIFCSNLLEALRMCFLSTEEVKTLKQEKRVTASESYQNSSLSEERLKILEAKLVQLMEEERLYDDPNLKLEDVSHRLGVPSYQISQVIRFRLNKNFYDLVNSYRINTVKELLKDQDHDDETILDIAIQAGFNSKSSFNSAFKKLTGQTPSQYRKSSETS